MQQVSNVFNVTPNTGIVGRHRSKGLDEVDRLYIKNQMMWYDTKA